MSVYNPVVFAQCTNVTGGVCCFDCGSMGDPSYGDTISYGVTAVSRRGPPTFSNGGTNVSDESGTSFSSSDKATTGAGNIDVVAVSMIMM
ncbi:uncharacterized protein PITG_13026 [Phytophthora infestans T30-4]|uniref:Uncharacterized protein n=1 Tax=Phytophthora infestans (strain T30-4) TaxID=403677 RepID=D0NK44_PHYIT|nr:uncharacterized protein PITG_13026 [Phytophthora infestans T30-4]EEY59881.1 hypothetical protein PITG_13026 [Phytophthora infestans T30-4]|eukprot:XP_002900566.1 hypothetical protein PITG_13026 [Phytophthora infestans T30-4]